MQNFKIRASACSQIMTGTIGLTQSQKKELAELVDRDSDPNQKPLTANMIAKMEKLEELSNSFELPEGVKTFCENWVKEQIYRRKKQFSNKYTEKGLIVEDNSLDFVAEHLKLGMLIKNEDSFEDENMTGTPDAVANDFIIDVKNSWDCFTFPLFEDKINASYFWQGQVYMHLTGRKKFKLVYTLMNTPVNLIEREARNYSFKNGYGEPDQEMYDKFEAQMTYDDIPNKHRIKVYEFDYDEGCIRAIESRVKHCRIYINKLINNL